MKREPYVFLCLLLAAGCGTHDELVPVDELPLDVVSESATPRAIYGGSPASGGIYDAVVSLHRRSGNQVSTSIFCSGTLISEDVVLTAAHCLDVSDRGKNFQTVDPLAIAIHVGDNSTDGTGIFLPVSETLIHPDYDHRGHGIADVALVRLAFPLTGFTTVPALPAGTGLVTPGATVDFAGFGLTENGTVNEKLHVEDTITAVDSTTFEYDQTDGSGPCSGDSGGPAFVTDDAGTVFVAGTTSYGDANCVYFGVSMRVDAYEGFISAFVDPAAPPPEPPPVEDGACGDGVCGAGESCDGRAATLACSADCDGKLNGRPSNRFCYVEGTCEGPGCP